MKIEEYIDAILHHLEKADDCEEVEQIIGRSIERMWDRHFDAHLIDNYAHKLYEGLKKLTPTDFDSIHWCNIRCAVMYLNKITEDLKK